jgi:hypothetical protein
MLKLNPALRMVQPMPYVEVQRLFDAGNPPGMRNYWKGPFLEAMTEGVLDTLLAETENCPSPMTVVIIQPLGGAARRVPEDATAMGWRGAKWAFHMLGMWAAASQDDANIGWIRNAAAKLEPWSLPGAYLNYLMDEGEGKVKASFGNHYARMVALKNQYDPTNVFSLNQNIKPTV